MTKKTKTTENPFYGNEALLNMFQQMPKLTSANKHEVANYLKQGLEECSTLEQKQLFYSIIFSLGDVSNREHDFFKDKKIKEVDAGGNSLRNTFIHSLEWMCTHSDETKEQFYKFLPIISEYTNFENLFIHRLVTDRMRGTVKEVLKVSIDIDKVTTHLAGLIKNKKTTDFVHTLIAKFLPRDSVIKQRKRVRVKDGWVTINKTPIQTETKEREEFRYLLLKSLSEKMRWVIKIHNKNTKFIGVEKYKSTWNRLSEAYLFSSKEILNFDKLQFADWLEKLPSGARFRTQNHLLEKGVNGNFISNFKWKNKFGDDLGTLFLKWEAAKVIAQEKLLSLTDEDKKDLTAKELHKLEKDAKVNIAASTLASAIAQIKKGNISKAQAKLISQSILDKIKMEVPVLIFTDVSGSMQNKAMNIDGVDMSALDVAGIATTAFLMKNPMSELKSILGIFSTHAQILSDKNFVIAEGRQNRYMHSMTPENKSDLPLIDKTKSFAENWQHIDKILKSYDFGSTNISDISLVLNKWANAEPDLVNERKEQVAKYPIHLYISDGDFNSYSNSAESLLVHRSNMKQWFGWDGISVIWDVKSESSHDGDKFKGIPNTLYFGSNNPSVLNQIFSNINDLDVVDVYLPLKALFNSNRYSPVRGLVNNTNDLFNTQPEKKKDLTTSK